MAFESLTDKLTNVFKGLRSKGKLTEEDVRVALKEVKMALLEADVSFKIVKQFINSVSERAVGEEVLTGLNPAQMVIKIVNEELTKLMGEEVTELTLNPGGKMTVIMMCGLQGSGKTTTAAKIAGKVKSKGKSPLLVAGDVYRPAAVDQLKVNAEKVGSEFFSMGTEVSPVTIAKEAIQYAESHHNNVVILDTAGRLQIDETLMQELIDIKNAITIDETLLVVDAMTGQEAVNVAEPFYPDRMASRILGMGDVLTLIDKAVEAKQEADEEKERQMAAKLKKGSFDFNMYLESMKQMRSMGGLGGILNMLPGMGKISDDQLPDEKELARMEAIVLSMTPRERENPKILTPQRKFRIAKGSGNDISVVNRFIKQFEQAQKMMKQMGGMKRGRHGMGALGGLMGMGGGIPGMGRRGKFF